MTHLMEKGGNEEKQGEKGEKETEANEARRNDRAKRRCGGIERDEKDGRDLWCALVIPLLLLLSATICLLPTAGLEPGVRIAQRDRCRGQLDGLYQANLNNTYSMHPPLRDVKYALCSLFSQLYDNIIYVQYIDSVRWRDEECTYVCNKHE